LDSILSEIPGMDNARIRWRTWTLLRRDL
jgi:hypothetical protein